MALVLIHASKLSPDAKKRIGDHVITALHNEGLAASSTVVLFKTEEADIYLEGGPLIQAEAAAPAPKAAPVPEPAAPLMKLLPADDFKTRARRTKDELNGLKDRLVAALRNTGGLSSFDAQKALDLQDCDWAPATLRRFFAELEQEGLIKKEGQKRGTRYVLVGAITKAVPAQPILQKKEEGEG